MAEMIDGVSRNVYLEGTGQPYAVCVLHNKGNAGMRETLLAENWDGVEQICTPIIVGMAWMVRVTAHLTMYRYAELKIHYH